MIEMFKIKNELAPPIMNLITPAIFKSFWQKGKELCIVVTISYWYPQLWSLMPEIIKEVE